jgi:pimeloyl-ACP methyl ester carboxylesterase
MAARQSRYLWEGKIGSPGIDEAGTGPSVLLLPALSSISTRAEMRPLLDQLAADFHVHSVDWPGFGDAPPPRIRLVTRVAFSISQLVRE